MKLKEFGPPGGARPLRPPLDPPLTRATTNIHFKPQSQMQHSLLQKLHSSVTQIQNILPNQKTVALSHHNPGTSFNF